MLKWNVVGFLVKYITLLFVIDASSEAPTPLQPCVDNIEPPRTASPPRKRNVSPDKNLRMDSRNTGQPQTVKEKQGLSPPQKPRLTTLAKRCQEINNWDDDYSYHSSSHGSQVAVEGNFASPKSFDVHDACPLSASNLDEVAKPQPIKEHNIRNTDAPLSPSHTPSVSSCGKFNGNCGESSPSSYASLSAATKAPSSPHVAQHPKLQPNLQTPNKTGLSQNANASPTKKLVWDRGLLNSLVSKLYV